MNFRETPGKIGRAGMSVPYLHCSGKLSNLMKYYIA
jgi:hypothetical protein